MATVQPSPTDTLAADNHALMHKVYAIDSSAPALSVLVDSNGTVSCGTVLGAFMPPKLTTVQKNALTAVEGMEVYDTTLHAKCYYNGSAWKTVSAS